eukprot:CAMPEP_0197471496 /NCGR_PEP_ID=MMETSP1309-20131121/2434_1 /TAXON_ID=464262 /ORGANISM="Genus nov. species nov., Strain RCC998" /LENGTH=244 /DNA_ID=CAMNT_0043009267 /DNA_START=105 /DNA_END=839 /DNA_ORIENTATION=-
MDNHEHFLAVGKSCSTSAAAMELIRTATAEPGMIAFEELSELPAVRALQDSDSEECRKYFKLLTIFRHGTWSTYRSSQSELPELSPAQEVKLRQLSLISLAEQKKVLPYSVLQEELQLSQVRDIEDFLIDCMVLGLLNGKLDQKQRHLEVEYSKARDVRNIDDIITALENWRDNCDVVMGSIQTELDWAHSKAIDVRVRKEELDSKIEEVKKNIRTEAELRGGQQDMMTDPVADGEGTRSKRRR